MNIPTAQERTDNLPLAVGVIILTVLALSLGDALIKLGSGDFVIWQIFVLRSLLAIPLLVIFMAVRDKQSLRFPAASFWPNAMLWTVGRSMLLVAMWVSYYIALPHLSLSIAAAAYYTLPIFITLFAALFTGEKINHYGWTAVVLGFTGVLLILQPASEDFNWYALLPILAAILYALAMILTRTRCRAVHPLMLSLALNIAFVVTGGIAALFIAGMFPEGREGFLLAPWTEMNPSRWVSMGMLAIIILIGSIGAAIAYQNGPPSIIGIFDFGYVGFAVLWSILIFNQYPDTVSVAGIVLIVAAGIISLRSRIVQSKLTRYW